MKQTPNLVGGEESGVIERCPRVGNVLSTSTYRPAVTMFDASVLQCNQEALVLPEDVRM